MVPKLPATKLRQIRRLKKEPTVGIGARSALEAVKSTEMRETLLLVMDDPDAKKLLVAWTLYKPTFREVPLLKDETLDLAWTRLWDSIGYLNFNKLSQLAGVPYQTTILTFSRLRDCRLIYPDGTINKHAHAIIATEVTNYLKPILPKYSPPPKESVPLSGSSSATTLTPGTPHKGRVPQSFK